MNGSITRSGLLLLAWAIGSALSSDVASAANIVWDGTTGASWNNPVSWSQVSNATTPNPSAPPGAADLAIFNIEFVTAPQTVNLNTSNPPQAQFARGLVFNSTGTVLIQTGIGTNPLTLGASGITINAGANTITSSIVLAAAQTWTNNSSNPLVVSGNITNGANLLTIVGVGNTNINGSLGTGGGGLTKNGGGSLTLGGSSNTFAGGVTINAGTLRANGDVTMNNGALLNVNSGSTVLTSEDVTIDGGILQRNSGSVFSLAAGKTLAIQNGGRASFTGDYSTATNAVYNLGGTNSIFETLSGGALRLNSGAQANVTALGLLSLSGNLEVGNGTSGTLSANGANANITQSGASALTVGHATTGTARINIGTTASGATLTTGAGLFAINNTGTVTVGSATTTGALNANGDVTIDGGVLQVLNSGSNFVLAAGKTFNVQNGGRAAFSQDYTTPANAVYNINGGNSTWDALQLIVDNGAEFNVDGSATTSGLTIEDTGTVNIGSNGTLNAGSVVVDGGVLQMLGAFQLGGGSFMVLNGGRATFDLHGLNYSTALHSAHSPISGTNSTWELVNESGLSIVSGREVQVNSGGSLSAAGDVFVGGFPGDLGMLSIYSGGTVTANSLQVTQSGFFNFIDGTLGITGPVGLVLHPSNVGTNFVVDPNHNLNVTNATTIPVGCSLTVDGGTLNTGSLVIDGAFNFYGGTLSAGSIVNNNSVRVVGTVDFNGPVSGPGDFTGPGTARFNGGLAPGASAAGVSFDGNVVLGSANTLVIELGGATPGSEYDRLSTFASATLDGALNVSLTGGFMPSAGQQFTILTAGSIVNNGFTLGGSAASSFSLIVNSTSVILQAIGLPGDYDHDGDVDGADLLKWQRGESPNPLSASDLATWRANFGMESPVADASTATPEPAACILLLMGMIAVGVRRRGSA